jgi:recombination protein RecT
MSNTQIVPFEAKVNTIRGKLSQMKDQFLMALPRHVKVEQFMRVAVTSIRRNPDLAECTIDSLLGSFMQSAQLGLQVDGLLGEAHLVPFNNKNKLTNKWEKEAQLIVGYKGLMKLARNSGEVSAFYARAVYMKDHLVIEEGLEPKLEYKRSEERPCADGESLENCIRGAFALVRYKDGSSHFVFLWKWEIDRARLASKNSGGVWKSNYPEMAEKTAMRRLAKWMPQSVELQKAYELEERVDAGISQGLGSVFDVSAEPQTAGAEPAKAENKSELAQALDAQKAKTQPAAAPEQGKKTSMPKFADSEPDPTKPGGDLYDGGSK